MLGKQEVYEALLSSCDIFPLIYFRIVKEMISRQPFLANEVDRMKMTPLHYACQEGHFEVVIAHESLLGKKGILDAQNSEFDTALHLSCGSSSEEIVRYLIFKGANVNASNSNKLTPLHIVTRRKNVPIAKILLKEGAEVNCQDESGFTPLHYAAKENSMDLVHLLCRE